MSKQNHITDRPHTVSSDSKLGQALLAAKAATDSHSFEIPNMNPAQADSLITDVKKDPLADLDHFVKGGGGPIQMDFDDEHMMLVLYFGTLELWD